MNMKYFFYTLLLLLPGCQKDPIPPLSTPVVITNSTITSITTTGAICSGEVIESYGSRVIKRGIYGSESLAFSSINFITEDGQGTGIFTSTLTNLRRNTTYYVKAYAINEAGISYGRVLAFKTLN
jgi:hypothetical protein